jgi:hypothetical protein
MAYNTPSSIDHLFTPALMEESRRYGEVFPYDDNALVQGISDFLNQPSQDPIPMIPGIHVAQDCSQPQHQYEGSVTPDSMPGEKTWPNVPPSVGYGTVFDPGLNIDLLSPPTLEFRPAFEPEMEAGPHFFPGLEDGPVFFPESGAGPALFLEMEAGPPLFPAVDFQSNAASYLTPPMTPPSAPSPRRKRGRPRTRPEPDPNAPKRRPGRPSNKKDSYTRISRGRKEGMTRAEHKAEVAKRKAEAAHNSR